MTDDHLEAIRERAERWLEVESAGEAKQQLAQDVLTVLAWVDRAKPCMERMLNYSGCAKTEATVSYNKVLWHQIDRDQTEARALLDGEAK